MDVREALIQTQDQFQIKGSEISAIAGISPQHWSEYRKGRTDIVSSKVWATLDAMESLRPGARRYFCSLISEEGGEQRTVMDASVIERLIEDLPAGELYELLTIVGARMMALIDRRCGESSYPLHCLLKE